MFKITKLYKKNTKLLFIKLILNDNLLYNFIAHSLYYTIYNIHKVMCSISL